MPDSSVYFKRNARKSRASYLGIAMLIGVVLLVAWMQFQWLSELRGEEEARRRVALHVAATNYAEYVGQEMNRLLEQVDRAGSVPAIAAGEPLLDTLLEVDADGTVRIRPAGAADWLPVTRAGMHQRLGRELIKALGAGRTRPAAQLWLDPPAVVYCPVRCQVGVLDVTRFGATVLAPAAKRMFDDFGAGLRVAINIGNTGTKTVLYPSAGHPARIRVADLEQTLLAEVPVLGPRDTRWFLEVDHGGSSLEAVVATSHMHNLMLSAALLVMLVLSIGLVVFNARRQVSLAREHLYFVAGISHELRTPLSVVASAADNLADCTLNDDPRVREYGTLIRGEVRRLKDMIENVLQFAQSASAIRPRARADVDMAVLVREVLDRCAAQLKDRELHLEIAETLPTVRGDHAALRSALTNLVTNAALYASGGNWIRINAIVVRVRPRGRALRIGISNPVAGQVDARPKKLFEPFYRGQQARAAGINGTGIGLAVARNIAQQHGGGVSVDTAQRGVIKFTLFLPVHEPSGAPDSAG